MAPSQFSTRALVRWIMGLPILSVLAVSFVPAYAAYIFLLQPYSTSVSKSSLALAGLIWAAGFILTWFFKKRWTWQTFFTKSILIGASGALVLINLYLLLVQITVPYPYFLLPSQSITIQALDADKNLRINSFATENQSWIDLPQFKKSAGWQPDSPGFSHIPGNLSELVWQGKPGLYLEIQFFQCAECGRVQISGSDFLPQQFDLSRPEEGGSLRFRHEYAALFFWKGINLLALEGALFLVIAVFFQLLSLIPARIPNSAQSIYNQTKKTGHWPPILALAALTLVTYALKFKPILFNDDWCQIISDLHFQVLQPFMLNSRRPLHLLLDWLAAQILPLDQAVHALLFVQIIFLFLSAVLIYLLISRLFEGRAWFALLVSALWLVFPNDYTYLYLSVLGVRLAFLLMLVVMLLLLRVVKTGSLVTTFFASILVMLSLLMYEAQLGILAIWPLLLILRYRQNFSWRKILWLGEYYLAMALCVVWRLVFQANFYQDGKLDMINLPLTELLARYFAAFRTILGGFQFPAIDASWFSLINWGFLGLLLVCGFGFWLAIWRLSRSKSPVASLDSSLIARLGLLGGGFVIWAAGYFPLLLNFPPNIYGHLSRVNSFSNLGGAFVLVTLIEMVASGLTQNKDLAVRLTSLAALVVIGTGAVVQLQVQDSYGVSWTETKAFYQALFEKVPNVAADTQIVVLFSGYDNLFPSRRTPFTTPWEAVCALQFVYNQASLTVNYQYDHVKIPDPETFGVLEGIMQADTTTPITQPENLLVVHYDGISRELKIERNPAGLLAPGMLSAYAPEKRILPLYVPILTRKLVQ